MTDRSEEVSLDDFLAHMPSHRYIFKPTRDTWPAASVNARVPPIMGDDGKPTQATIWLDEHRPVEQITWVPGLPMVIEDRLLDAGGWIEIPGCAAFNQYRAPTLTPGDPAAAQRWVDHVASVYGEEAEHIINWLAHRVQRPGEKLNHALVLGGKPGIGKDTLLEPVKHAVGPWNFEEINPSQMLGRFNGFVKSVVLRISEARDLGDVDRFAFYDHSKALIASPPDVIRVDEKHLREYSVPNLCGVIITTNYKTNGLFLPEDDRRHFVAWSDLPENPFAAEYWNGLWRWYGEGGTAHVAAYLMQRDLSGFNPKAPPRKTEAFWNMVNAGRPPEEAELADIIDALGNPNAFTLDDIAGKARDLSYFDFAEFLTDRKTRRQVPHRLESAGYEPIRNPDARDGLWRIRSRRRAVYARSDVPPRDRIVAARELS